MARLCDKDFVWTPEFYDFILDTPICEKLASHPYIKEWTVRELLMMPNKRGLILEKYPSFPDARPSAAVVSHSIVNIAANSPSPPSNVNTSNVMNSNNCDNLVYNSNVISSNRNVNSQDNVNLSKYFNFNLDLATLSDAFKFNAGNDSANNEMDVEIVKSKNIATENANSKEMDFETVKSKRKLRNLNVNKNANGDEPGLKIAKHAASSRSFTLPTQNKFNTLNETVLTGDNSEKHLANNTTNIIKPTKRISYPKTRFITIKKNGDLYKLCDLIKVRTQCNFKCAPSGEFARIFPESPESYKTIVAALDDLNIQHYVIPDKSSQPLKVVIRGLDRETQTTDIEAALKALNFTPQKVNQMTNFKTKKPMPLFQIHLDDNSNNHKIFELKERLYQWVVVVVEAT